MHCLLGDTEVQTSSGSIYIEDIFRNKNKGNHPSKLKTITYDQNSNSQVYSTVNDVLLSGTTDTLVKVTLENGESIVVTPNHRLLMSNGEYIEAQHITEETNLMEVNFTTKLNTI